MRRRFLSRLPAALTAAFVLALPAAAPAGGGCGKARFCGHDHGHTSGHHHHYVEGRIYTYPYRRWHPGPRSYYRPYYNHHLTMQYPARPAYVPSFGGGYGQAAGRYQAPPAPSYGRGYGDGPPLK